MSEAKQKSVLEKALSVVTDVRAGEGVTALLLTLTIFLVLSAYYIIKPVREALILVMESGAQYKSYMSAVIAVALLVAVPLYAGFARRQPRNRLIVGVTLFFVSHLVLFYLAAAIPSLRTRLGLVFYLWVGIFNMMVVAQFWAFANDVYREEQGKRLFPLVGIGASLGASVGAWSAGHLVRAIGNFPMLLVAAGVLAVCAFLTQVIHVREVRGDSDASPELPAEKEAEAPKPEKKTGAFAMVFAHKYLVLMAAFALIFSLVNTNGEYMLGSLVSEEAEARIAAGTLAEADKGKFLGGFYSDFFFYVNVLGLFLQTFVISRIVKIGGVKLAFFILPVIALGDALLVATVPLLAFLQYGKIAENATDYSINNTARQMLWLPTTTEMKYIAKQAVDTFFVRMGDVASAVLVFVLAQQLSQGVRTFAIVNVGLIAVWIFVGVLLFREQKNLPASAEAAEAAEG